MTTTNHSSASAKLGFLPALGSLIIPGAGQFRLGRRWRGAIILLTTGILAFLISWALAEQKIGQVECSVFKYPQRTKS